MAEELNKPVPQKSDDSGNADSQETRENIQKTYDVEGLIGGGIAGLVVGIVISFNAVFALEIGMFVGLIIGTRFKKNK